MIIKDKIYINTKELGTNIQELCSLFTYDNPEFYQKKKLKLSTGSVLDTLYHYRTERIDKETFLLLPRGGIEKVRKFYEDHKLPFRIKDDRISHEKIDVKLVKTKIEGQQKLIIDTLIKNEGGLIESQPGCLSGDTVIRFNRCKKGFKLSIKKAYEHYNHLGSNYHNWDLTVPTYVRSFNGLDIKLHEIENIVFSGVREVYTLTLADGKKLKATADHKIMTSRGWVEVKNLNSGDVVMCDTPRAFQKNEKKVKYVDKEITRIQFHPHARTRKIKNDIIKRMEYHRLVYEAHINNVNVEEYITSLKTNKEKSATFAFTNPKKTDIHHIDFDHYNNDPLNLVCLLKKHHKSIHKKHQYNNFNQGTPHFIKIESIEPSGKEETYDIICKDPHRNFCANDVVVHNSGKTIACLGFISKIKQPTLIFVHEHRLSSQWKQEIGKRLSGNFTLGEINGDVKKDGDIVIGIINSLYNLFQNDPSYFDKFGAIVVDETHKLPANMFMSVINNLNAKYRVGVTGTVDRKDGKEILLFDVVGPKLLSIQASQIKHRIMPFEYVMVNTNTPLRIPTVSRWTGRSREDVLDITSCITKLTESDERNSVIISKAMEVIDSGYFPLILSDRVDHNKKMYNHLKELGYNVALLIGETRKKTNWEDIRNDETIQCIVANTAIASEALDLPRLSSVFFTTVSSNYPKIAQRIGRIRRFVEGKILPLVVDFVDNLAYMDTDKGKKYILKHMATKRIKFYEKLKSDYNNDDGDCFEGS